MILSSTYQDLNYLLDTLNGLPLENQKDIEFREAIRTVIEYYEENNNE